MTKNCEANEGRSLFSRCGIFIRPFWGPGELGVSLRAFSAGVNAHLRTWKQLLYLRTWKQRLYFLTGTSGTYGDSHFKALNDFFAPTMFPSSSQCVLSKFTKFPMCSLTCSELHLSLSHISLHRRCPLGTYVGDKIVGLMFLAPQLDFAHQLRGG